MAVSDPGFSREQRRRVRSTRKFLGAVIENAVAAGELPEDTDAEWMAAELLTAVNGVAVQALFDRLDWPVDRQRAMVRAHYSRVARPPDPPPDSRPVPTFWPVRVKRGRPPAHHRSNIGGGRPSRPARAMIARSGLT